jgi:hypothetical protein
VGWLRVGELVIRENSHYEISRCYWVDAHRSDGHSWKLMARWARTREEISGNAQEIVATAFVA